MASCNYELNLLDDEIDEIVNMQLSEVLRLFDSPLSQEQCWSIVYGVCKTLLKKKREDHLRKEMIRYITTLDSLVLTQRGEIEILHSEPNLHETQKESELIFTIGNIICRCLDFGLDEVEICEVRFQDDMAELIGGMVLQSSEFDEGIGDSDNLGESWESRKFYSEHCRSFKTIDEVLRFCNARLLRKNIETKGNHYLNITKALYLETSELKAFLGYVLHDFQELNQDKDRQQPPDLAKKYVKEWAKLWIQVMEELRQKTREVREQNNATAKTIPPETEYYQYQPFDIASLGSSEEIQSSIKSNVSSEKLDTLPNNPENKIFDFLRSRASTQEDQTRSMTPDSLDDLDDDDSSKPKQEKKKVLEVNDGLARKISNWDQYSLDDTLEEDYLDGYVSDDEDSQTKDNIRVHRNSFSHTSIVDDYDVFADSMSSLRRKTISHITEPQTNRLSKSEMCLHKIDIQDETDLNKVGASLTEIFKIRQELTRAEMDLSRDDDVRNCKKCFGCRKNKFSFFQRARLCAVCKKKYCFSCIKENISIPPSLTETMPLNIDITHSAYQVSNLVRSKSVFHVGTSTTIKQLPWQRNAKVNGARLSMCDGCRVFVDSIQNERKHIEWKVQLELDI